MVGPIREFPDIRPEHLHQREVVRNELRVDANFARTASAFRITIPSG